MQSFIEDVLNDLKQQKINLSDVIFVLPSKRAGIFLKSKLHAYIQKSSFTPDILSIEKLIDNISGLRQISGIELLFKFYDTYEKLTPKESLENFDVFSKWAQTLIQDFNEIDRYLIDPGEVFDYMSAAQVLKRWSLNTSEKSDVINNYISFWELLRNYYYHLKDDLISNKLAYQGLIYRVAADSVIEYNKSVKKLHVFLGFNALNTAEEKMFTTLLENSSAKIYWNIDDIHFKNKFHSAGVFTRNYEKNWRFYRSNPFNWITSNYLKDKKIEVIGCSKSIGQSKYVGHILEKLQQNNTIKKTAVVLGDENLLIPILNSIPSNVDNAINITMGLPLKSVPLASLFDLLFNIHRLNPRTFYFRDVVALLSHQMLQSVFYESNKIVDHLKDNNITYISKEGILSLAPTQNSIIEILFGDWQSSMSINVQKCLDLIEIIRLTLSSATSENRLELEYLYRFNGLFNEVKTMNSSYNYIDNIKTLYAVYKELLNSETLDFQGEPLDGLQIMGVLESRVLDFETVIITSVNEGILPGGKTNNSFIPFDFKIANNLPTYREKDAVYTYHFYSLIQRAKNIYLLYNTEVDVLKGGEKSRFITQLEIENIHTLNHKVIAANTPKVEHKQLLIEKTPAVTKKITDLAQLGFSPSSLTGYIRNPLEFYYEKILGVKTVEQVEETVAFNTLGTVIHNTLEDFYKPLEGHFLEIEHIKEMKLATDEKVRHYFREAYKKGDVSKGKNLIIFEITKRYVHNFLNAEIELLKSGSKLKIIAIEVENKIEINVSELNFPIKLKGIVDRVDQLNGVIRIIDYKSGKVEQNKVEIIDWEDITTDYDKYSKSFQILTYAYMMYKEHKVTLPIEAGIISFKNLKSGFLKFAKKETSRGRKDHIITEGTLLEFEKQLKKIILEILNPNIPFIEKKLSHNAH